MEEAAAGVRARVQQSFERQGLMEHLGARISYIGVGEVCIELPSRPEVTQQHGYFHAGATSSIADSAGGYAAFTLFDEGTSVLTVEFKINLLAPARGPRFRFEGRVAKAGRTISVVDGRALQCDADGSHEKLVATMSATVMTVAGRGIQH